MAEPPALVAVTFKPAGQLQLHRLGQLARFHCVRCQEDKTGALVATMTGDWAQTVCIGCYDFLVHAQGEDVREAAKAKRRPVQAEQELPRKIEPRQLKRQPPQPMSKKQRRQLENERRQLEKVRRELRRQLPGLDSLLAFFRATGVRVELVHGRCLRINDAQTAPLAHLPPPETLEWNSIVNEIALKYLRSRFIKAVKDNARFGEGVRVVLQPGERGFAIMRGDVRLAVIHATRAQIPHREVIHANFLMPGPHWRRVADVLHGAEAELMTERKNEQEAKAAAETAAAETEARRRHTAARRRIDHLPDGLAPELIATCLDASRRIRLERQVAYERPVVLESDFGELTLLPIIGTVTRLLMPFRLTKETDVLNGELILGDRDPLPLLIGEAVADKDAIPAWICALLGFADATCIKLEPTETAAQRATASPPQRASTSASQRHPWTPALPRRQPWPRHLEPVGHWVGYSGSFVAGHRRRLNEGQTASTEACDRARQVGIILHPHETWIRAHTRGVPDGIEMRFRWHAPAELRLSLRSHDPS
jgi:hypothetical protein